MTSWFERHGPAMNVAFVELDHSSNLHVEPVNVVAKLLVDLVVAQVKIRSLREKREKIARARWATDVRGV